MADFWRPGDERSAQEKKIDEALHELGEIAGHDEMVGAEGPQVRIAWCAFCKTVEELPFIDPKADVRDDVLLEDYVARHTAKHPHAVEGQVSLLGNVSEAIWANREARRKIIEQGWSALKVGQDVGPGGEFYDSKSTYGEDASKCFVAHRRSTPCIDWHDDSKRIGNPTQQGWREGQVKVYICDFCPVASYVMEQRNKELGRYDN